MILYLSIVQIKTNCNTSKKDTIYIYQDIRDIDIDSINKKNPKEDLYKVLISYNIKFPEIVYCIAVKETGNFTSKLYLQDNNLFGLYDNKNKKYYHFDSWEESVLAYKYFIEKKYNGEEDYYRFLTQLPYAMNKNYIKDLKILVKQFKTNHKYEDS